MQIRRLILREVGPFEALDMRFPEGTIADRADVHLLVGPNGCGKTTALIALAQCFAVGDVGLAERLWSDEGFAAVDTTLGMRGVLRAGPAKRGAMSAGDVPLKQQRSTAGGRYRLYYDTDRFNRYEHATAWAEQGDVARSPPLPFAVFAYSGLRHASPSPVQGVTELKDNPLVEACSFSRPSGTSTLVQWLVNSEARRSLYLTSGQLSKAEQRAATLQRFVRAIAQVVEQPVRLQLDVDPFALKIAVGDAAPAPIDLLPDGLQSLLSWVGDLLMRLDRLPWADDVPVTDRRFVLLLDEVEVHLHPKWQQRVIPMAERLFPNAQIIASTHSPFVIGSASDAWIHVLGIDGGRARLVETLPRARGTSYPAIVDTILGLPGDFDYQTEQDLQRYRALWHQRVRGDASGEEARQKLARELAALSEELSTIIGAEERELRVRLSREQSGS